MFSSPPLQLPRTTAIETLKEVDRVAARATAVTCEPLQPWIKDQASRLAPVKRAKADEKAPTLREAQLTPDHRDD
jgi:hypothetical protein